MALGPEGQLALWSVHGPGQVFPGKVRVLRQKGVRHLLVLLRQDGAGGVDQGAAGPDIGGGVVQNGRLDHWEGEELVQLLLPDVRLLPDDAQTSELTSEILILIIYIL